MKAIIALLLLASAAHAAEPLPVPKIGGSCPNGWLASGGSCVPSGSRQDAIPRTGGSCPWGWLSSGAYCVRSGGR